MLISDVEYRKILDFMVAVLPKDETDTVRIYELCKSCGRNVTKMGEGIHLNQLEYIII